ncbi:MAG: glycosyltransferase [Cetobacterium sp.]
MIPKKIHYIWLGKGIKPNLMDICVNSWYEKLSDYEIIEWTEENLNFYEEIEKNEFLKECHRRKLWAFLSDYFRIKILYDHGGIYLDGDMEILKSLDGFLDRKFFLGYESLNQVSAGIIGSEPGHEILKEMLDFYKNRILKEKGYTIPDILQRILIEKHGLKNTHGNSLLDLSEGITIYPPEYFYPYHYTEEFKRSCIKKDTYGIHWWGKSWHGKNKKLYFLEFKHIVGYKKMFINILIVTGLLELARKLYEKYIKG